MIFLADGINITIDTTELVDILEGFPVRMDRSMHDLMSDIAKRSKSWVAQESAGLYNIKKGDVSGGAVTIRMKTSAEEAKLDYKGEVLTPTHYKMSPKSRKNNTYTLKVGNYKRSCEACWQVDKEESQERSSFTEVRMDSHAFRRH